MSRVSRHLLPTFVWNWSPVDESCWGAWTDGERLVNLSPTGDTLRVIEVAHCPRPLTDEEEAVVADALRETGRSRGEVHIFPNVVGVPSVRGDTLLAPILDDLDANFVVRALIHRLRHEYQMASEHRRSIMTGPRSPSWVNVEGYGGCLLYGG